MTKIESLGYVKRKTVNISPEELIKTEFLKPDSNFPLVIKPSVKGVNLQDWAKNNREYLKPELLKYGAILFGVSNLIP